MTTEFGKPRGRPPGAFAGHGNPYPELQAEKYDLSVLATLDDLEWAKRINVPRNLTEDQLLIEISRAASKVQELRAPMLLARVRLIELTVYAVIRSGISALKVSKAAGMRKQALNRWLDSYREDHADADV